MLINPSPLFRGKYPDPAIWVWVDQRIERSYYSVACNHGQNLILARIDRGPPMMSFLTEVFMEAIDFRISPLGIRFHTGQCPKCQRIFWACDSWEWVKLLTDQDQLELILKSVGVPFREFKDAAYLEPYRAYFRKGKFEPDMTERANRKG